MEAITLTKSIEFSIFAEKTENGYNAKVDANFKNRCSLDEFTFMATSIIEDVLSQDLGENNDLEINEQLKLVSLLESITALKTASFDSLIEAIENK